VKLDARESQRPGWKFNEYEVQGVPIRLAIGPRDVKNGVVEVARRDTRTKESMPQDGLAESQHRFSKRSRATSFSVQVEFREANTTRVDSYEDFKRVLDEKGGFVLAHWDGTDETEARIKDETKATIRLIPLDDEKERASTW
jgi:prolyl-tRNA synthetase